MTPNCLKLRRWNTAAAVLQLAAVVGLVGWYATGADNTDELSMTTYDEEGNVVWDLTGRSLIVLLTTFSVLTAAAHAYYAQSDTYCRGVLRGFNRVRWLEYTVTATIMMVIIALSSGVEDHDTILSMILASVLTMPMGLVTETAISKFPDRRFVALAVAATLYGWALMTYNFYHVVTAYEDATADCDPCPPDFVTYIVYGMLTMYAIFGFIQVGHVGLALRGPLSPARNVLIEQTYTGASMVAKLGLVIILATGLSSR
jgi:hypothetical protein